MIIPVSASMKRFANIRFRLGVEIENLFKHRVSIQKIPVIINNFNRLECLKELLAWLDRAGMKNIHIIDNNSTLPLLKEYYKSCHHKVYKLNKNVGFMALWKTIIFQRFKSSYYIYTDPDIIPVSSCPLNVIEHFRQLLTDYPQYDKVGFGLKIDDIPDHYPLKQKVLNWEKLFWEHPVAEDVYEAPVDTTFALYRPYTKGGSEIKALRTGGDFVARHTSWYVNPSDLSEEDKYYQIHANSSASWTANLTGKETHLKY